MRVAPPKFHVLLKVSPPVLTVSPKVTSPPKVTALRIVRAVVPVVDLAVKFGRPPTEVTKRACVLVVDASAGGESFSVGLLAAAVNEVVELAPGDVEPPPPFGTGLRVDYLLGLGKTAAGFVLLLELDRVVTVRHPFPFDIEWVAGP